MRLNNSPSRPAFIGTVPFFIYKFVLNFFQYQLKFVEYTSNTAVIIHINAHNRKYIFVFFFAQNVGKTKRVLAFYLLQNNFGTISKFVHFLRLLGKYYFIVILFLCFK